MNNDNQTTQPNAESDNQQQAPLTLTAYCMKTKQKNVPILNAVLKKTKKGTYMAMGVDDQGNKLTTIVNSVKAEALISAGIAVMA